MNRSNPIAFPLDGDVEPDFDFDFDPADDFLASPPQRDADIIDIRALLEALESSGDDIDGPHVTIDTSWQDDALCAQSDPEAFFPEKGGSTREAKKICGRCPAADACLQYALDNDERFGIWGGLSERERRDLKRSAERIDLDRVG